jgi:hypothetical protein
LNVSVEIYTLIGQSSDERFASGEQWLGEPGEDEFALAILKIMSYLSERGVAPDDVKLWAAAALIEGGDKPRPLSVPDWMTWQMAEVAEVGV